MVELDAMAEEPALPQAPYDERHLEALLAFTAPQVEEKLLRNGKFHSATECHKATTSWAGSNVRWSTSLSNCKRAGSQRIMSWAPIKPTCHRIKALAGSNVRPYTRKSVAA